MTMTPDNHETALDRAVRLAGDDPTASGRVFDALFNAEMVLRLEEEPAGDILKPALLALEAGPAALAFDRVDRLAAFTDAPAPYAAMPGRALVTLLAGKGVSLAVNPGVAPSELFYDPEALAWAADFLGDRAVAVESARVAACAAPVGATPALLAALDAKLAALAPALAEAWLVRAALESGPERLLLTLRLRATAAAGPDNAGKIGAGKIGAGKIGAGKIGAGKIGAGKIGAGKIGVGSVEAGVAQAVAETGRLADPDAPELDVIFVARDDALLAQARAVGLGFEMPAPPASPAQTRPPAAPGMDPDAPPILR